MLVSIALAATPDVDAPLRSGATSADAAVVIGIEEYAFLPKVPYANRDAEAMSTWLVYTRGIKPDRVSRLYGSTRASREKVLSAVRRAADSVGPDGTLWVTYSGHGAASRIDGARMLVGVDAMADESFDDRGVRLSEIEEAAGNARVVFLVDACYSGVGRAGGELLPGRRFAVPTGTKLAKQASTLWTATSGNELAGPYDAARHGTFTYWALGALRGWADGEISGSPDGKVDLGEANQFVSRKLREGQNFEQTPAFTGSASVVLAEGRLEAEPRVEEAPKNAVQRVEPRVAPPTPSVQPVTRVETSTIQILEKISTSALFHTGKVSVRSRADAVAQYDRLDAVIALLESHPDLLLRVEGHTDNTGNDEYNQRLSEERAARVAAWITEHGISADRVSSAGYGETRPIDTNATDAGRASNRRIEFHVTRR